LTTATISPALRALIDERLDGIDRVLRESRMPRPERLEILDSVEDQILEMLAKRTSEEPGRRDLLAVLAELDPPEAYATGDEPRRRSPDVATPAQPEPGVPAPSAAPSTPPARWSTLAILSGTGLLVWILGAVVTTLVPLAMNGGDGAAFVLFGGMGIGAVAAFVNTGIGIWAMVTIARSKGALKGMALAAAGACLPLLVLFHVVAAYLLAALATNSGGFLLVFLGIPYVMSLPLPVAWALYERFRHRPCPPAAAA
jgi:hypothetical protein